MALENKRWIEISVLAERGSVDDLMGLFSRYCPGGAAMEELRHKPDLPAAERVVVKGFIDENDQETLQKVDIALLLLSRTGAISEPRTRLLEPEDWAEAWKAFFPPLPIGERLVIVPTWVDYTPAPERVPLYLDPGMAFGTGLHATTRLCLIALERLLEPELSILDCGTGSGILAIAAVLLGASHVDAIDTDPVSVEVARENSVLNHVSERISVMQGTLPGRSTPRVPLFEGGPYDLLLINILAEVIIDLAPTLQDYLVTGGRCVASGIIAEKADAVRDALQDHGLDVSEQLDEDGWVALVAQKRS